MLQMNAKSKPEDKDEDETVELDVSDEEMARRYLVALDSSVAWVWLSLCPLLTPGSTEALKWAPQQEPAVSLTLGPQVVSHLGTLAPAALALTLIVFGLIFLTKVAFCFFI
jgi:hypothetical protein